MKPTRFIPLIVLLVFVGLVTWRLAAPSDERIVSRLTGKPVPHFNLDAAIPGKAGLSSSDLSVGKPHLLNIFASWCVPCIAEAPQLLELQRRGIPIVAIAIRDRPADIARFLAMHGDPFERIGGDPASKVQMALGSSGVPETFLVDGRGIIRAQHIGAIEERDVARLYEAWAALR